MITVDHVERVLNEIVDPCSVTAGVPAGLCDMGLIRDVVVSGDTDDEQHVSLTVGVTEPSCFLLASFANEARIRLLELPGVVEVSMELDSGFDWTENMMSPEYRSRLEAHRDRQGPRRPLPLQIVDYERSSAAVESAAG